MTASEFLQLVPEYALVIIFMWFVLELGKRTDAKMKEMDENAVKTVEAQTASYMEALALQNDQNKATIIEMNVQNKITINEMNDRYLLEMRAEQENFAVALDTQRKHYEEALTWRDNMLKEQREADRASMKEIVSAISRMATILDRHDKETADAILTMKERARILEGTEINKRLPKTIE